LREKVFLKTGHLNWLNQLFFDASLNMLSKYEKNQEIRLLDIGCGNGEYVKMFLKKFPKSNAVCVEGMDSHMKITKNNLSRYSKRVKYVTNSFEGINKWPKIGKFDVVAAFNVFHFISQEDLLKLVKGVYKLLNKKGVFIPKQITQIEEGFEEYYSSGSNLYYESQKTKDKKILEYEREYLKLIKSGEKFGFKTNHIRHTEANLLRAFSKAGFKNVETTIKLYNHLMIMGIK